MANKYKYLVKNIGILSIGNFTTKLLNFFLVPLYTAVLTTTEYGEFDLLNTTVGLLVPVFTLNIFEGIFRYALDKSVNKGLLTRVAFKYFFISLIPLGTLTVINLIFKVIPIFNTYLLYFVLMYIFNALSAILTGVAKGMEKLSVISVAGVISSAVVIISNILFLLVFKFGIHGYFVSYILGSFSQCFYIILAIRIWKIDFSVANLKADLKDLDKKVVAYSKPLIANSIGWWVNNVSDRFIVTMFCGFAVNGIYSIAYKIPTFLNVLVSIFNQAWNLSAIKDFDKEDKSGFFAKIYSTYNCLMVIVCSGMIVFNKVLASLFYSKDFYSAWKYVPFLLIAFYFGAISGYIGAIFAAIKRTDIYAKSTVTGAIVNTLLNLVLVYFTGALGAAIATTISYILVWAIRYYYMTKFISVKINLKRDIIIYVLLILQAVCMIIVKSTLWLYVVQGILFLLIAILLINDIRSTIKFIFNKMR